VGQRLPVKIVRRAALQIRANRLTVGIEGGDIHRNSEERRGEITADPRAITRPDDSLLTYYVLVSLCALFAFPIVFLPLFVRFKTLRYEFDGEGVKMSWGFFFRREVYLTYRRIQDIHVNRNLVERWMGLAKVPIQTASGTSGPTMKIEGIRNPEPLRDFLYERMKGAREDEGAWSPGTTEGDEALAILREIRDALRGIGPKTRGPGS
jgi:putative membrane protein